MNSELLVISDCDIDMGYCSRLVGHQPINENSKLGVITQNQIDNQIKSSY